MNTGNVRAWRANQSTVVRSRRIAVAYRQALHKADKRECTRLDAIAKELGETWVLGSVDVEYDDEQLIGPADAAHFLMLTTTTLAEYRRQGSFPNAIELPHPGGYLYRVGDLKEFQRRRARRRTAGTKVGASRRSAPISREG